MFRYNDLEIGSKAIFIQIIKILFYYVCCKLLIYGNLLVIIYNCLVYEKNNE